jgi:hypothetical protein
MLDILDYLQKLAMERGVKSRVFVMWFYLNFHDIQIRCLRKI